MSRPTNRNENTKTLDMILWWWFSYHLREFPDLCLLQSFEYSCRGREDATSLERFGDSGWDPRSFGIWRNNQQIEIFKTGQLENCHGCPFYHAEEGSAINIIISILNCVACWFFCQKVLKISVQAILQTRCPLHLPLFPSTSVQAIFRSIHSWFNTFHRASSRQLLSVPVVNSDWLKTKCWVFKSKSQN